MQNRCAHHDEINYYFIKSEYNNDTHVVGGEIQLVCLLNGPLNPTALRQ